MLVLLIFLFFVIRTAIEVQECVQQSTVTCGVQHASQVWEQVVTITRHVDQLCSKQAVSCFMDFRQIGQLKQDNIVERNIDSNLFTSHDLKNHFIENNVNLFYRKKNERLRLYKKGIIVNNMEQAGLNIDNVFIICFFTAWSLLLYDGPTLNYNMSITEMTTIETSTSSSTDKSTTTQATASAGTTSVGKTSAGTTSKGTSSTGTTSGGTVDETQDTGASESGGGSGSGDSKGSGSRRRRSDESGESSSKGTASQTVTQTTVTTTWSSNSSSSSNTTSTYNSTLTSGSNTTKEACSSYIFVDEPWYNNNFSDILMALLGADDVEQAIMTTSNNAADSTVTVVAGSCIRHRPSPLYPELRDLCTSLYASWECMNTNAFLLDDSISETVKLSVHAVLQAASEKCRGEHLQVSDNLTLLLIL